MKKGAKRSMTALADAAFKKAVEAVIERAVNTGTPVILWINEAVQAVEPRKLRTGQPKKKKHP